MNLELYTALKGLLRDIDLYRNADHVPIELRWAGFLGETAESEPPCWEVVRRTVADAEAGRLNPDGTRRADGEEAVRPQWPQVDFETRKSVGVRK